MINKRKTETSSKGPEKDSGPQSDFLDDSFSEKIGSHLRDMYEDLVNEPVPDDFLKLLSDADDAET